MVYVFRETARFVVRLSGEYPAWYQHHVSRSLSPAPISVRYARTIEASRSAGSLSDRSLIQRLAVYKRKWILAFQFFRQVLSSFIPTYSPFICHRSFLSFLSLFVTQSTSFPYFIDVHFCIIKFARPRIPRPNTRPQSAPLVSRS